MATYSPKSVIIITQYFPPEMGAPQSRIYETALGLKKLGWEVGVVTAIPNYPTGKIFDSYQGRFFVKENLSGITILRYWLYASNSKRILPRILNMTSFSLTSLFSIFSILKLRPYYLIAESPPLLTGLTGLILSRITGAKFILNISDLWPLSAYELGVLRKGSYIYRMLEKLEKYLYRKAFACIGQSDEIVKYLSNHGASRAWLFRNGVDNSRFSVSVQRNYNRPLKVVYAGLLGVAQGILDLCVNLEPKLGKVELHFYGSGAERNQIKEYINSTRKRGIILHEPVNRDEIPQLLMQYDIALIPLVKPIYGAVPSKIYEAMAAGLPILFAGGGEGARIIDSYKLGWICPSSDYKQMQAILDMIVNMPDDYFLQFRENCIKAAKVFFDRKIQLQELHRCLTSN